jgi:NADH-quinone oxidoreductase subunit N
VQFDFKRLLGWSSIVHAGFMALGISTASKPGLIAIIFYLISYMLAVIIAFAIADELEKNDYSVNLSDLAGLFNKSPFAASALAISMVSLAGIPLTGGFIAKFLIVKSILVCAQTNAFFYLPIAIAVLSVAVSVYYYFKVIKIAFWTQRLPNSELQINLNAKKRIIMAFCVAGIILMGVLPNLFIEMSDAVITSLVK